MNLSISRRTLVRIAGFSGALALLLGGIAWKQHLTARDYREQLEHTYTRALGELSSYLTNISTDLDKGQYIGTPGQLSLLSARIWRESGGAKSALSTLPVSDLQLDNTYRFLSQVGDYAMSLSKKVAAGGSLTGGEQQNAKALQQYATRLREYVDDVQWKIQNDLLHVAAQSSAHGQVSGTKATQQSGLASGFEDIEQTMTGYPTLIYDGPFSDHLLTQHPAMLQGLPTASVEIAQYKAAVAAGLKTGDLTRADDENSNMPLYTFAAKDLSIGVTKSGGLVAYLLNARSIGEERLSNDSVFQFAEQYLQRLGYENMHATYYETNDGICTINYAATLGRTILYTDLIKVGVALDDGGIVFYDARGYLNNHKQRTLPEPALTADQARDSLNPSLRVLGCRTALIPTSGRNEVFTYEFLTKTQDEQDLLVYVNTQNGAEEQLLILMKTPNGTLTK